MSDLIRCGSFSYNLITKDHRVVPLERFTGFDELYKHICVLNQIKKEEEEEKRQNKINISPTPE